jgi:maltose alpha-D-glucosyltransferase/alpha-amylase
VFDAFGPDPNMQLYKRGIRRRLAPMMQGDRRRIELAYSLMMTLPGTPVLHYGDEIGMGDNLELPERNCARTPMQWSSEANAGFTEADKPAVPVISEGPYGFEHINVAAQKRDPNSLMDWMERIIRMRKEIPEIGWGDFSILKTDRREVLALRYQWRKNSVLFVHNLSALPTEVTFKGNAKLDDQLVNLLSEEHSTRDASGKHTVLLEPYGYRWFRGGGLDYLLKRSEI